MSKIEVKYVSSLERHPITGETTGCEEYSYSAPFVSDVEEPVVPLSPSEQHQLVMLEAEELPKPDRLNLLDVDDQAVVDSVQPSGPIDWTQGVDPIHTQMYNITMANLWNPRKHSVSNDMSDWHSLEWKEQWTLLRDFATLTRLDSIQAEEGMRELIDTASSQHERHILTLLGGIEVIHAQSYSFIFTSLSTSAKMVKDALDWATNHPTVKEKAEILKEGYNTGDPLKARIVSVLLESFSFFTGFFYPLYFASRRDPALGRARLIETGVVIGAILRDEATHGYYIGLMFQKLFAELSEEKQEYYRNWATEKFLALFEAECRYSEDLYADVGLVGAVKKFMCYVGNRAAQNLGFDNFFSDEEADADPVVIAAIGSGNNIDFFSTTSNDYKLAAYEPTPEEEWAIVDRPGVDLFSVAQE